MDAAAERIDALLDQVRATGGRVTKPRRAIVEALVASVEHPTADDLADAVHAALPDVHRSTVYRTLDALESAGLVEHVHLGHGRAVYHLVTDRHLHLVCDTCSAVVEVPEAAFDDLRAELGERYGFEIDSRHFALPGLCRPCAEVVRR